MRPTLLTIILLVALAAAAGANAQKPPKPPKQPHALSLSATPNPVKFGRGVTLVGKLAGPSKQSKAVSLWEDPFPFDQFTNVVTATSDARGDVSFQRSPAVNTNYKARQDAVESATVSVAVSPRLSLRVSDRTPTAGQRVRLSGTICPQHDRTSLKIQRRVAPGRWRAVRRVTTTDAGDHCSSYARRLRVRRDRVFRTFFAADADHAAAISSSRRIDVHRP
jgi:hypothetical protein